LILFRKQQKIINCQNEKFDEYESTRMTTMAEMKFVENKLQSFDINAKPSVTYTQVEKLQKVFLINKKLRFVFIFILKDVDNVRCEYEILKQQVAHWMPCDEPVNSTKINLLKIFFSVLFH
jgi:hypothetical protein